jgi:hypothetical protein
MAFFFFFSGHLKKEKICIIASRYIFAIKKGGRLKYSKACISLGNVRISVASLTYEVGSVWILDGSCKIRL